MIVSSLALLLGVGFEPSIGDLSAHAEPLSITPPIARVPGVTRAALKQPSRQTMVLQPDNDEVIPGIETEAPRASAPNAPALKAAVQKQSAEHLNVVIFGDSLGDGLWAGLYHVLRSGKHYSVIRQSKVATGFVRRDYFNWNTAIQGITDETRVDVAVIMMGTNDRQTIIEDGKRYALFDDKWQDIYAARIDAFTQVLQKSGARVYWVGLPVMRSGGFERDMQGINAIFKARALANGVTFIDTHALAADEDGSYAAYGTDLKGKKRLLRTEDGIHFTMDGYMLLARKVGEQIEADEGNGALVANEVAKEAVRNAAVDSVVGHDEKAVRSAGDEQVSPGSVSASSIGLKTQIYDTADIRPGRSDDWRWNGAIR